MFILAAILGLSVLVIIHEGGHYLAARAAGMRVLRFSIGFGPSLIRYQSKKTGTLFQVALIPFLAYVQIAGMSPGEEVDPNDPGLFQNKGWFARAFTIVAGPLANYLTASLIIFSLGVSNSLPMYEAVKPLRVGDVMQGSPAALAGLQVDDVIVSANGKTINTIDDLIEVTAPRSGQPTEYVVERQGQRMPALTITPANNAGRGQIGIAPKTRAVYQNIGLAESTRLAIVMPYSMTVAQLKGLGEMISRRTTEGIGGPVMMGKIVSDAAKAGAVQFLWYLMLISVALGMFNLLPFPALDGGRLVFLAYELVTRRRVNERIEMIVHSVGIVFLLGVMVLVTIRDIFGS